MAAEPVTISHHECAHCGAHVTPGFSRVYGDSNDRAHRCGECDSYARLSRGSAAGVDPGIPDPEDNPGRWGDSHVL